MIFVLIAGTYTPVALLALKGSLASAILIVLWAGALGGVIFKLAWIDAPKWLFAAVYVLLGLVSAAVFGELPAAIGWLGAAGLALGGALYLAGAVIYASGKPNPWPKVFGYHEVFHALVLAAAALQYAVIAFAVLLRGTERCQPRQRARESRSPHIGASPARAHPRQRALAARRFARMAGAPPVAEQVDVQLELLAGRGEGEHLVVQLLERRARLAAAASACPRARRACRRARRAGRRRTAARTPRSCDRRRGGRSGSRAPARSGRRAASPGQHGRARSGHRRRHRPGRSAIASRIALIRADFTFEIPPGRIASSTSATGARITSSQLGSRSRKRR